jgi:ubiquinone/menaquinone biosynthesis C-methylase UbiE
MGRQASRRIKRAKASVALVRGQAQALPLADTTFDCALSTFPTEFFAEPATIGAIYRVLCPGGRLVVVPQAQLTGGGSLTRFIEWLYAISGQRPRQQAGKHAGYWQVIQDRFKATGFMITFSVVQLESSEVTVVVAEKPAGRVLPEDLPL